MIGYDDPVYDGRISMGYRQQSFMEVEDLYDCNNNLTQIIYCGYDIPCYRNTPGYIKRYNNFSKGI